MPLALPTTPAEVPAAITQALKLLAGVPVAVIGDLLLDEYLWGEAERISPEAPVPVVRLGNAEHRLGGAANVARNVAALGGNPQLLGIVGDDDTGGLIRSLWTAEGGDTAGLLKSPGRITPRKTRILAGTQQLLRLDREAALPEEAGLASELAARLAASPAKAVLFSDYQKGTFGVQGMPELLAAAQPEQRPVLANPKPASAAWFPEADLISLNRSEALGLLPPEARASDPVLAGPTLRDKLGVMSLLITLGGSGMALFEAAGHWRIPAVASEVFDVAGAGDTVLAALGLARAAALPLPLACLLASYAAGVVVRKVGVATADPAEVAALAAQTPLVPVWTPLESR